jgi:tRNA(Ile)-lysidine synthase TilS/MesJ
MDRLSYPEWKQRHQKAIESLSGKSVMMFFSGGKDSSVALHFLQHAGKEFGFTFDTHAGVFPHHGYPSSERDKLDQYWKNRGISINWHDVRESDDRLAAALEEGVSPCLICNTAKKRALMDYIKTQGIDMNSLVIVMSYSLWDIVSASIEHILGAVFSAKEATPAFRHKSAEERYLETFQRFYPMLRMPAGFSIFKPLIYYNDQDIGGVLKSEGIPVLSTTCDYRQYRPKRLFAQYYERMNLQFDFKEVFDFAQKALNLPAESHFTQMGGEHYLNKVI